MTGTHDDRYYIELSSLPQQGRKKYAVKNRMIKAEIE